MLIKNANIFTMEDEGMIQGDLYIVDGIISEIGNINVDDDQIIDATGLYVYPGMVEAHCHLGMEETAIRFEGNDVNEMSDPLTPQVRGIDGCYPLDETVVKAKEAGVTTVAAGPGSANVIGGTFFAYKTYGNCIDEMVIKDPVAMKAAFGENPKRVYRDSKITTRLNIVALLRETLFKTKEYLAKKQAANGDPMKMPAFDMKLEAMIPVIQKKIPLKCHAHRSDDLLSAIRVAKEFDINITLDHCTDGEVIKKQLKECGYPLIVGPSLTHKSKYELANKSFTTPAVLYNEGIEIAITTDSPVVSQDQLPLCATLAKKAGLPHDAALKAITIFPAKALGLDDRIGSIKVGKDADFVICDRDLLDVEHEVCYTIINGQIVYQKYMQENCEKIN